VQESRQPCGNPPDARLPVMLLAGFLGAGKTTTLRRVLANQEGLRIAVIVNDVADINIDEKLLKGAAVQESSMVELSNGCMCCSLKDDLKATITTLARRQAYDLLIIEGTGIALPMPVAALFADGDMSEGLSSVSYLDTITTVVDAPRFVTDVMEAKDLAEVGLEADREDNRVVSDILVEQVEFADMLLVNKTDCVSEEDLTQLLALLRELNPKAKVITSQYGSVPASELVLTKRFSMEEMEDAPGWVDKLNRIEEQRVKESHSHNHDHHHGHSHDHSHGHDLDQSHNHRSASEVHGILSFVYTARRPFHPGRLAEELESPWPGLLRSKGFFWLATRNEDRGLWQTAGQSWSGEFSGQWDAASAAGDIQEPHDEDELVDASNWDEVWGDRMQELVFIGIGLDEAGLRGRLDRCLLDDGEMAMGPESWLENFEDPLPDWDVELFSSSSEETQPGSGA